MSTGYSGNTVHDSKVNVLEAVRQSAVTPTTSRANVLTAELSFHRGARDSAIKNNISPMVHMTALRELGYWS